MKSKVILLLLGVLTLFNSSKAQINLVPNPSFEDFDTCPDYQGQLSRAIGWYSSKNTPDYFNGCSNDTFSSGIYIVSVPSNGFGYHTSASGFAYSGIVGGITGSGAREFISAPLLIPLQTGIKYFASFKVSLAGQANPNNRCGVNKLGILFSTIQYSNIFNAPICNCASIVSDSILTDTLNWIRITGSFIADSAYSFFSIGRFALDSSTSSIQVLGTQCIAYYYLDDVCISEDSNYAYNYVYTVIPEINNDESVRLFPNPSKDFITMQSSLNDINGLKIYTVQGQFIQSCSLENLDKYILNISSLPQGIYFLSILRKNKNQKVYLITKL